MYKRQTIISAESIINSVLSLFLEISHTGNSLQFKSIGILNKQYVVFPPATNVAAIPHEATAIAIFPSLLSFESISLIKNVFPVLPGALRKNVLLTLVRMSLSISSLYIGMNIAMNIWNIFHGIHEYIESMIIFNILNPWIYFNRHSNSIWNVVESKAYDSIHSKDTVWISTDYRFEHYNLVDKERCENC